MNITVTGDHQTVLRTSQPAGIDGLNLNVVAEDTKLWGLLIETGSLGNRNWSVKGVIKQRAGSTATGADINQGVNINLDGLILDGFTTTYDCNGVGATGGWSTTANRPNPALVARGGKWYDTTLAKPIWSDGTVYRDATGTAV
jgi:hypothetical protein